MINKIFHFGILLSLWTLPICAQNSNKVDAVVDNIYNLDFSDVPKQITELEKSDPRIASFLWFDFLWWKMISENSANSESDFKTYKNSYLDITTEPEKDFKTLIYYLYQIRYENFKKTSFSKYLTALKCQVYLIRIDKQKANSLSPLEKNLFQLIVEFDNCLKYKLVSELDLFTKKNKLQFQNSLDKIDKLQNSQFTSFETIKNYFLGKIYLEIENDTLKAFVKFSELSNRYPGNKVFKGIKNECKSKYFVDGLMK